MRSTTRRPMLRRVLAVVAILGAGAYVVPAAFAGMRTINTIQPIATIKHRGQKVVVTGVNSADPGEKIHVRVTLNQRSTGAIAEGWAKFIANGDAQTWTIVVDIEGDERFQPGSATAVALAFTTDRRGVTDAHQWLVPVTLVE